MLSLQLCSTEGKHYDLSIDKNATVADLKFMLQEKYELGGVRELLLADRAIDNRQVVSQITPRETLIVDVVERDLVEPKPGVDSESDPPIRPLAIKVLRRRGEEKNFQVISGQNLITLGMNPSDIVYRDIKGTAVAVPMRQISGDDFKKSFAELGIHDGSTLFVVSTEGGTIECNATVQGAGKLHVKLEADSSVEDFKDAIRALAGVGGELAVFVDGRLMRDDNALLKACGVTPGSKVLVAVH